MNVILQIAGWSSMQMVARYAVFEPSDLDDILLRTAGMEPADERPSGDLPEPCPP